SALISPPQCSTLFPYTTLFRSWLSGSWIHNYHYAFTTAATVDGNGCGILSRIGECNVGDLRILFRANESSRSGPAVSDGAARCRSEEHTSELQSRENLVCRLLL